MAESPRAAVIGAGRIGRQHAKWYDRCGCRVAGFVVSSPDHIDSRRDEIAPDCPSLGDGFADVEAMLDAVEPALVTVSSPAEQHFEHARAVLSRGIPVLCEKPLVWHDDPLAARRQAGELASLAARNETLLAVNLQYTLAADFYRDTVGDVGAPERCEVVLESRGRGAERTPGEVWMELGPHALSLVFGLLPGYRLEPDSVGVETEPRTAIARLTLTGEQGTVQARVRCGQRLEGDLERCFGINGRLVDYSGRNNAAGEYCSYLRPRGAGEEREYPDLMRLLIERFVARVVNKSDVLLVEGEAGRSNLEAQLLVAEALDAS